MAFVTDPHFGRADPGAITGLRGALDKIAPDLVVVGGDLTQRSRSGQFTQVRAFLDALPTPWLAVPGNHDAPLHNLFRRVFTPLGRFRRRITQERAPLFVARGLRVLGLDSTRRKIGGRLQPDKIAEIARLPGDVTPGPVLAVEGPSPSHRLPPVRGFFVVAADATAIEVALWTWDGQVFAPGTPERFPRRNHALAGQ